MRYDKKPLTFEAQAEQLRQRGLKADLHVLIQRLRATNYYRFTSYLYTFRDQGDNHDMPPVWMMVELMDFGSVLSFYRGASTDIRRELAATLGLSHQVTLNWLLVLNSVRNRCAHHARLWNWNLGYPITIPERDPRWGCYRSAARRLATILHVCRYWLAKADAGHSWHQRVSDHFAKHPHIDLSAMGLKPDWQEQALWKHPS